MIRIFKKDLKLYLKDKRAVLLTFLLPIILITLFAFAFGGIKTSSKPSPIKILITDMDKTKTTEQLVVKFDSIKGIEVNLKEFDKAKIAVTQGKYAGVLVFYKGFEDSLSKGKRLPIELMYDRAQEMQIGLLQPVLMNTLMKFYARESMNKNVSAFIRSNFPQMDKGMSEKIIKSVDSKLETSDNKTTDSESRLKMTSLVGVEKDTNLFLIQAIAGVAIMMLLFSVSGLSAGMLDEKENGTLKRLLYSPIKPNNILFGKMITALTISITQLTVMFVFTWLAFGLDISKNIPALILMILSTSFAVSGIGIFLASISRTRAQAQGFGTIVILTMSAIGGSMIPLFIMPAIMQKIAVFSINYWGIQGFYDIFWRGLPTSEIMPRVLVLIGIGILLSLISVRLFRRNVEMLG